MSEPDVYIYLDEFVKGQTFNLCATFIPAAVAPFLLNEWNALRADIKSVLLAEYPDAAHHSKLSGDQLPEIHAAALFHSDDYYRKYRRGSEGRDKYWLRHYEWLEKALQIIDKHQIQFIPLHYTKDGHTERFGSVMPQRFDEVFQKIMSASNLSSSYRHRYSRARVVSLSANVYLPALAEALIRIGTYLKQENLVGKVVCDNHDISKGFLVTESINWLRQNRRNERLTEPAFASGLNEPLLQVCDVLCYIAGQVSFAIDTQSELEEPLLRWATTYIPSALLDENAFFCDIDLRSVALIVFEIMVERCAYDGVTKDLFKNAYRDLYKRGQQTS